MRVQGYDYAQPGAYFVTVCTQGRAILLADIDDGQIRLNRCAEIVEQSWLDLPARFRAIALDVFAVMPNHVHGVIFILPVGAGLAPPAIQGPGARRDIPVGAGLAPPASRGVDVGRGGAASSAPTLGDIVRVFKSKSTLQVNRMLSRRGRRLWQRSYYDRIIRDEAELTRVQQYIIDNPLQWELDRENPEAPTTTKDELWQV